MKKWKPLELDLLYLQCRTRNEWYHPWIFRSSWILRRFYLTGCCWQRSHCYFRCRGWRTCRPRKWSWHVAARGLCNQKGHFQNQPEKKREKFRENAFLRIFFSSKYFFFNHLPDHLCELCQFCKALPKAKLCHQKDESSLLALKLHELPLCSLITIFPYDADLCYICGF